jgi:hypothetical protein
LGAARRSAGTVDRYPAVLNAFARFCSERAVRHPDESSCKRLAEARVAQSGMRWTIKAAPPTVALRALHRSDDHHDNRYNRTWDPSHTPPTFLARTRGSGVEFRYASIPKAAFSHCCPGR